MDSFEGRTAVITGGASGIGLALAERFVEARMQVVLADVQQDALDRAVAQLKERQAAVIGVNTNTMLQASVQALADAAIAEFGKVHIVCNNAGVASMSGARAIWEVPSADWDWVMGVNFNGVLYGLQAFVPHMLEHGEPAHIVNTASLAGLMPGGGTYGVSKHGVLVLSETLHNDLKAREANVGVSVLCPGFVDTNIFDAERNRPDDLKTGAAGADDAMASFGREFLKQGLPPSAIADAVLDSIREERLYILPHPAWDAFVRRRVEAVLERRGPASIDFEEMMRRRAAGEQF